MNILNDPPAPPRDQRVYPTRTADRCSDCPPAGYPTEKTRCYGCPLTNTYKDATGELVIPTAAPSSKKRVKSLRDVANCIQRFCLAWGTPIKTEDIKGASNDLLAATEWTLNRITVLEHGLRKASERFGWLADFHLNAEFSKTAARELMDEFWKLQAGEITSVETKAAQAPIARIRVANDKIVDAKMLAPGLPTGVHSLYCEPEATAPYMRAVEPPCICEHGPNGPPPLRRQLLPWEHEFACPRYRVPEKASARPIPPGRMCNTHGNWNCSECCPPENGTGDV